jgi:hypothetical protein
MPSVLFIGLLNCVAVFPAERDLLYSEFSDRAYEMEPFFVAYNLIELPLEIISAFLYTICVMFLVGLNFSLTSFFCMVLAIFALVNVGESIGIAFCSFVNNVGFSVSLTNSVLGVFTVMSGILSAQMPVFLDRFNRISPVPYFARLLLINEFESSKTFSCTVEEIESQNCIYRSGSDVLRLLTSGDDVFKFEYEQFGFYIIVGCILTVVYRILSYLILKARTNKI